MELSKTLEEFARPEYVKRGFLAQKLIDADATAVRFHPKLPYYVYSHQPMKGGRCRLTTKYSRQLPGRSRETMNSEEASTALRMLARVVDAIPDELQLVTSQRKMTVWSNVSEQDYVVFKASQKEVIWDGPGYTLTQGDVNTYVQGTCWEEMRIVLGGLYQNHWLTQTQAWLQAHKDEIQLAEYTKDTPSVIRHVSNAGEDLWVNYHLKDIYGAVHVQVKLENPERVRVCSLSGMRRPQPKEQHIVESIQQKSLLWAGFPTYQDSRKEVLRLRALNLQIPEIKKPLETELDLA